MITAGSTGLVSTVVTREMIISSWKAAGCPAVPLSPGETAVDLEKYLMKQKQLRPVHARAIKEWYEAQKGGNVEEQI